MDHPLAPLGSRLTMRVRPAGGPPHVDNDDVDLLEVIAGCERFHRRLHRSLATIAILAAGRSATDPLRAAVVQGFLVDALPEHLVEEEQLLFPTLRTLDPPPDVVKALDELEAGMQAIRTATRAIRPFLQDLSAGRVVIGVDLAVVRMEVHRLRDALADHVRLEEERVFPWVREVARSPG